MASALYRGVVGTVDRFVPGKLRGIWEHPAGPKTVFFWAPTMKWCLVGAGIADLARPAEKLSLTQRYVFCSLSVISYVSFLVRFFSEWCFFIFSVVVLK